MKDDTEPRLMTATEASYKLAALQTKYDADRKALRTNYEFTRRRLRSHLAIMQPEGEK